jgi:hypothetical protein
MKLKPCPFCGGDMLVVRNELCHRQGPAPAVLCLDCNTIGPPAPQYNLEVLPGANGVAVRRWNRRKQPKVPDAPKKGHSR